MPFSDQVLFNNSPVTMFYFVTGWISVAAAITLLILSMASLSARGERSRLAPSIAVVAWIALLAGAVCLSAYLREMIEMYFSTNPYEKFTFFHGRAGGYYAWAYWIHVLGCGLPLLFLLRRFRANPWCTFFISLAVLGAVYCERLIVFITAALNPDVLPQSWRHFYEAFPMSEDIFICLLVIFVVVGVRFVLYLAWMPRCRICKKRIWPTKDNELYDRIHASCYWKTDPMRQPGGGGVKPPPMPGQQHGPHIPD